MMLSRDGVDQTEAALEKLRESGAVSRITTGGPFGVCASCGKYPNKGTRLKSCSACNQAWYCGRECQGNDFKLGHKNNCAALRKMAALSGSTSDAVHGTRPWRQGIADSDLEWANGDFRHASVAARRSLVRSPELRGLQSRHIVFLQSGDLASAPSADEVADDDDGGDPGLLRVAMCASLACAREERLHGSSEDLPSLFGAAVQPLVEGLVNVAETKTLERLASRGLRCPDIRLVGFPVVECNAHRLDDVLSPRKGETNGVGVAVFYLDAETTQYYIRQRYAEVPTMSQEDANAASEQQWETLCSTAAKQESQNRVFLLSHFHQTPPCGFSILTCSYPEIGMFDDMVRNELDSTAPSALKTAQGVQVELLPSKSKPIGAIRLFDCDQASFAVMGGGGGGGAEREIVDALQKTDLGASAEESAGSNCVSGEEPLAENKDKKNKKKKKKKDKSGAKRQAAEEEDEAEGVSNEPAFTNMQQRTELSTEGSNKKASVENFSWSVLRYPGSYGNYFSQDPMRLLQGFVQRTAKTLYGFAAAQHHARGPGCLVVTGKIKIHEILCESAPPASFGPTGPPTIDRQIALVWVTQDPPSHETLQRLSFPDSAGNQVSFAPCYDYDTTPAVKAKSKSLPGLMRNNCNAQSFPYLILSSLSGKDLVKGTNTLIRPPNIELGRKDDVSTLVGALRYPAVDARQAFEDHGISEGYDQLHLFLMNCDRV